MSASDTPPHEQFVSDEVPKPGLWEAARNLVIKRSEATSPRNPGTEDHRPGAGKTGGDEVFQSADPPERPDLKGVLKTPEQKRLEGLDRVRKFLAIGFFALISVLSLTWTFAVVGGWLTVQQAKDLAIISGPAFTITAAVAGWYFGSEARPK